MRILRYGICLSERYKIGIMKKLLILLCLLPIGLMAQEVTKSIDWISWDEVEAKMEKEPRKVLVDVYTKWCGPCRIMNSTTFSDPTVIDYINENYYAIKFDAEGAKSVDFKGTTYNNAGYDPAKTGRNSTHELTKAIAPVKGRIAYPTIVYMDETFQILSPVQGLQKPEQIMPILNFFGEDIYKDKTWQEYQQTQ